MLESDDGQLMDRADVVKALRELERTEDSERDDLTFLSQM